MTGPARRGLGEQGPGLLIVRVVARRHGHKQEHAVDDDPALQPEHDLGPERFRRTELGNRRGAVPNFNQHGPGPGPLVVQVLH